jgi:hypothetical protein
MRVYKPGDILVSTKLGVITILEQLPHHQYKCRFYDKETVKDCIKHYQATHLDGFIEYETFKFYPVKE